jgi:hypothetical protein
MATASAHADELAAQLNLDQVTAQQNLLVAAAQQADDMAHVKGLQTIAAAQAHLDAVQLSMDTTKIAPAQIAYDLNATAPKAVQDVMKAQLDKATGQANKVIGAAQAALETVTGAANTAMEDADLAYGQAQQTAGLAIATAGQLLTQITNSANVAIAAAQGNLTTIQGQAGVAEAQATGTVAVTRAQAATQFGGSGLVVNLYGVDMNNATNITSALDWYARSALV